MTRIAALVHDRARRVLAVATLFFAFAVVFGPPVAEQLSAHSRDFQDPAAETLAAEDRLEAALGEGAELGVVAVVPQGADAGAVREGIASAPSVTRTSLLRSDDGRTTFVAASIDGSVDEKTLLDGMRAEAPPGVLVGGPAVIMDEIGEMVQSDLARAEMLAFPLLFLLSLLVFRGLIAALLPPLIGAVSILTTFLVLRGVDAGAMSLSVFALNLVTGIGLGLAIDYSLFVVSRFREELAGGRDTRAALLRTMATAGRTVLFSALTIAAAAASLLVFPQRFLQSMGLGGAIVAVVAALVSLTVLPAILALLGPRVNALAPRRLRRAAERTARPASAGGWYRLAHGVMRRPLVVAVAAGAFLLVAGLPFLRADFISPDHRMLPGASESRVVAETMERELPEGRLQPIRVVVDAPSTAGPTVHRYAEALAAAPGAGRVKAPQYVGDHTWQIQVVQKGDALSAANRAAVSGLRSVEAPFEVEIGGRTASFLDQRASLGHHLPIALALLGITTFVLLFLMTGSVVLPIKALVMNLLTLSAAFGVLVLVFQDGRLEGLLDFKSAGALEITQPLLLFAIAFGLATDYGVFLLARIKEARDAGMDDREAVAFGVERTGRIVTSAALLFCVAMGAFATSGVVFIKQLGVGTVLAVAIDATIVRALLVPALMALLGRWNWWAPAPLRWLHARIGLREATA